jgi:hypothetical protein
MKYKVEEYFHNDGEDEGDLQREVYIEDEHTSPPTDPEELVKLGFKAGKALGFEFPDWPVVDEFGNKFIDQLDEAGKDEFLLFTIGKGNGDWAISIQII